MGEASQYEKLGRLAASTAVTGLGWRYILGEFRTQVLTGSLPLAADVAGRAAAVAGAQGHLRMDVREDRVVLALQTAAVAWVTPHDVELAHRISAVVGEFRLTTQAGAGGPGRCVQVVEIGIDAMDIAAIRPFWQAVLGYADEPGRAGPPNGLVDPLGQGPAVWFQRWTRRGRSATASTSTSACRTTRHTSASRPRWRPAARSSTTRRRRPSGYWPTPRATRRASRPGRAGTARAH